MSAHQPTQADTDAAEKALPCDCYTGRKYTCAANNVPAVALALATLRAQKDAEIAEITQTATELRNTLEGVISDRAGLREMNAKLVEALDALLKAEWMVTHDWGGDRAEVMEKAQSALAAAKESSDA